mmetsp:Transcript_22535/g.36534  ORF Transcript_22535/g.36534 Transcript_22535/m.36534 type:complete len:972 (-) Transcript_22535:1500-4415(-)
MNSSGPSPVPTTCRNPLFSQAASMVTANSANAISRIGILPVWPALSQLAPACHAPFLRGLGSCPKKTRPKAPAKMKMSATLNTNGLSMPQQDMFRKSRTKPYINRSRTLASAPPISNPALAVAKGGCGCRHSQTSTPTQIAKAIAIRTQTLTPSPKRPKLIPRFSPYRKRSRGGQISTGLKADTPITWITRYLLSWSSAKAAKAKRERSFIRGLMPEMTHAGKDHCQTGLVCGGNHLIIAHRTAGLDQGRRPGLGRCDQPVSKGEERIRRHDRPLGQRRGQAHHLSHILCLAGRDARAVHAAHLACAHTDRGSVLHINDGVGFHMFRHRPGKEHIGHFLLGRLALGHHFQIIQINAPHILVLHEEPARHLFDRQGSYCRIRQTNGGQKPQILLLFKNTHSLGARPRRNHNFGKDARDLPRRFRIQLGIQRDNATKGRGPVTIKGPCIRLFQRGPCRNAAGVGMFDDGTGRPLACKFADQLKRRIGVIDVVIGQFLTLMLHRGSQPRTVRTVCVKRRRLMRVLAITQRLGQGPAKGAATWHAAHLRGHPGAHRRVIGRRPGIGRLRQTLPQGIAGLPAIGLHLGQNSGIILNIDHHRHKPMVLRRRADHRRAANVDILDHFGIFRPFGHGFFKRIEVHNDQIDGTNLMGLHRGHVVVVVAQGKQTAMDHGMQCLDAAIHHLGKTGHLGHVLDVQPRRAQRRCRTARAQQFNPVTRQCGGKLHQPRLVGHRDQGTVQRGKVGHGAAVLFVWDDTGRIPVEIADAHGSFLRFGQGPAHAGGIIHRLARQHDLQGRARFQAPFLQIDARLQGKRLSAIMAKHPNLTAFQRDGNRGAAQVQRRVHLRMQMKADIKGHARQLFAIHHPVKQTFFRVFHGQQHVLARHATAVKGQLKLPRMGQPVGFDIAVVPALKPQSIGRVADLNRHMGRRIHQRLARRGAVCIAKTRTGIPIEAQDRVRRCGAPRTPPIRTETGP